MHRICIITFIAIAMLAAGCNKGEVKPAPVRHVDDQTATFGFNMAAEEHSTVNRMIMPIREAKIQLNYDSGPGTIHNIEVLPYDFDYLKYVNGSSIFIGSAGNLPVSKVHKLWILFNDQGYVEEDGSTYPLHLDAEYSQGFEIPLPGGLEHEENEAVTLKLNTEASLKRGLNKEFTFSPYFNIE